MSWSQFPTQCHPRRLGLRRKFEDLTLLPGATRSVTVSERAGAIQPPYRGVARSFSSPADCCIRRALIPLHGVRQQAYSTLCGLVGANYTMTEGQSAGAPGFGSMALAVLAGNASGLAGFDDWSAVWDQFRASGTFPPLAGAIQRPDRRRVCTTHWQLTGHDGFHPRARRRLKSLSY